jgi:hypothetical protein
MTIGQTFSNGYGAYCAQFDYSERLTVAGVSALAPNTLIVTDRYGRRAYVSGKVVA